MTAAGKSVIVTGASSGIGAATAKVLAAAGAQVMLAARREDRLKALAAEIGGDVKWRVTDVTDHTDMLKLGEDAIKAFGKVDVIVNNAGIMPLSPIANRRVAEWDQMIDVNIKGVLYGIAAVLPEMTARGSGHVVNIASVGALQVFPAAAVYCATKYAVRAISDGLRMENDRIRVTCIHPGVVESELADTITDPVAAEAMKAFRKIALKPDAIARAVRFALEQADEVDVNEIVVRPTATTGV